MAMDVFQVLGSISIDTTDFNTKITDAIARVNALAEALNNLSDIDIDIDLRGDSHEGLHGGSDGGGSDDGGSDGGGSDDGGGGSDGGNVNINTNSRNQTWTVLKQVMANIGTRMVDAAYDHVREFVSEGFDYNRNKELWQAQLAHYVGGDTEMMNYLWSQLEQHAVDTPYSYQQIMDSAMFLLSSNQVSPEQLIDTLETIGELASGSTSNYNNIARAYVQVLAKGKLQAEEANRQFANANVQPYGIMADYFSLIDRDGQDEWTEADVIALAENPPSMVTGEEFRAGMYWATHSPAGAYTGRMNTVMDTTSGKEEKFGDLRTQTAGAITERFFEEYANTILPYGNEFFTRLNELTPEYDAILQSAAELPGAIIQGIGDVALAALEWIPGHRNEFNAGLVTGGTALTALSSSLWLKGIGGIGAAWGLYDMYKSGQQDVEAVTEAMSGGYSYRDAIAALTEQGLFDKEFARMATIEGYLSDPNSMYPDYVREKIESGEELSGWDRFVMGLSDSGLALASRFINVVPPDIPAEEVQTDDSTGDELPGWLYSILDTLGLIIPPDIPAEEVEDDSDGERGGGRRWGIDDPTLPTVEELRWMRENTDRQGDFLPGAPVQVMENIFDDNGSLLPGGAGGLASLVTNLQNLPQQITAAVQSGFSGATVQINLTTGDVRLNEGTLVGVITPMVNARLGTDGARAERM